MKISNLKLRHFTVLFFCILAAIYHGIISSDIYEAEAKIVIKGDSKSQESPLSNLISGASGVSLNSSIVKEYISSKNSLVELDKRMNLRDHFSSRNINLLQRFNPFGFDHSIENFYEYTQKFIYISLDDKSSLLTVKVKCFEPELCVSSVKYLIEQSERAVNLLNKRAVTNANLIYLENLNVLKEKRDSIIFNLEKFRLENDVVDIEVETKLLVEKLRVLDELHIQATSAINSLSTISSDNSQFKILAEQKKGIEDQIKEIRDKLSGVSNSSIVLKSTPYSKLLSDLEIYEKILASAIASYQTHLVLIKKESVFLEQISEPIVPESAIEPRRLKEIFNTIIFILLMYVLFHLVVVVVKENSNE